MPEDLESQIGEQNEEDEYKQEREQELQALQLMNLQELESELRGTNEWITSGEKHPNSRAGKEVPFLKEKAAVITDLIEKRKTEPQEEAQKREDAKEEERINPSAEREEEEKDGPANIERYGDEVWKSDIAPLNSMSTDALQRSRESYSNEVQGIKNKNGKAYKHTTGMIAAIDDILESQKT